MQPLHLPDRAQGPLNRQSGTMLDSLLAFIAAHWVAFGTLLAVVVLAGSAAARRLALILLRLLAHPLLLAAVVALVYDGTRTLADGKGLIVTSLSEHWQMIAPATLDAARAFVTRRFAPALWDPVVMAVLRLPAWLVLGGLGLAFAYLGRKRREANVFAN